MGEPLDICREPIGSDYRLLLEALLSVCSRALLVVRDGMSINSIGREKMDRLQPWFLGAEAQHEWPGTRLLSGEASIMEYEFDPGCCRALGELVDGLYAWRLPDAPEDLCLLRADRSPALVSIAHEADSYLELAAFEMEEIRETCPGWSELLERLCTSDGAGQ